MADIGASSNRREGDDNAESDETSEPQAKPLQLDLGDDLSHERDSNRLGNAGPSGSCNEVPRREDNPFSFKHFLRGDLNNPYQNKGARPKVYCNTSQNESRGFEQNETTSELKASRKVTEYPSVLPDFVQDHLVIEQCYLGNNTNNDYNIHVNHLPDFTPARNAGCLNFDASPSRDSVKVPIPLDLPGPSHGGFPFDLPAPSSGRNNLPLSEVGNSKSLPDFLADSAVCSQISDSTSVTNSPEGDSDRVRQELDIIKEQLSEQTRLCEILRQELILARNKEHEYTQNLARALGKVEENLEKSNRRATTAENTVLKLRQEVKALTVEISRLRMENESLKCEEASGGHGYYSPSNQLHSHRLAQELRAAASTAEHSLRQLLTGVDNLRIMASSLENMHRIEEKNDPFSQFDEGAGPAL